jgi:hypothetical protein
MLGRLEGRTIDGETSSFVGFDDPYLYWEDIGDVIWSYNLSV